jgi:hypothetical protein
MHGSERFGDHGIFFFRDIGATRISEIENTIDVGCGLRACEIACYKAA